MSKNTLTAHRLQQITDLAIDRPRKRAVSYLRVSSSGQVNTDYDPEGISLPAQREAVARRADQLDADIIDEYLGPAAPPPPPTSAPNSSA